MRFRDFCEYLDKLEKISGRLEMANVLAELLGRLKDDEIDKGVYLMLGELAPKFAKIEFSLADKQVMKAIARSVGKEADEIKALYKEKGDLGEVVHKLFLNK